MGWITVCRQGISNKFLGAGVVPVRLAGWEFVVQAKRDLRLERKTGGEAAPQTAMETDMGEIRDVLGTILALGIVVIPTVILGISRRFSRQRRLQRNRLKMVRRA